MKYRTLGRTGLSVSEIGLGALPIGGPFRLGGIDFGRGDVHDRNSDKMISVALDAGVNFIDLADIYGYGKAEDVVGRMLKGTRQKIILSTKAGNRGDEKEWVKDFSSAWLKTACEKSLQRLRTDYLDLFLLHTPAEDFVFTEEIFAPLNALRKEGKIRFYGVSVGSPAQGKQSIDSGFGDVIEVEYNLCERGAVNDLFPAVEHADMGLIIKAPLASGLLSGKYSKNSLFPEDDFRFRLFPRDRLMKIIDVTDFCKPLAEEMNMTPAQFALRYVLMRPEISSVITGAKTAGQILENVRACDVPELPVSILERIEERVAEAVG